MALPSLSAPTLYTATDLAADLTLVDQITSLVNDAFYRSKLHDPAKWLQVHGRRFPTRDSYLETIGKQGVVVTIFDKSAEKKKIVAVAGAIPWGGGWKQEGASAEDGWEIKAVAVHGDERYLHRGLGVRMYAFLEQYLVSKTKELGFSTIGTPLTDTDQLALWILAAECINGVYWRKNGYEIVRKSTYGPPTWGCQTSFEMVVLRKYVALDVASNITSW